MAMNTEDQQPDLFETAATRSLLDQLFSESRLYTRSKDYKDLLDFVVRLRNFAPFNAMLLQVQKPGLGYAASAHDWSVRFGRRPKEGARPLLILWPFGPVALVYDVVDTEGRELPEDVSFFPARGDMDSERIARLIALVRRKNIRVHFLDAGDRQAGSIRIESQPIDPKHPTSYRLNMNRNHAPPTQFVTISHELGHLLLGHLGPDKALKIPMRSTLQHSQEELEAESVAYLVCARNGVKSKSETYLSNYVREHSTVDQVDLYQIMRAAGHVEQLLGLSGHTKFGRAGK
jgi:hypothetical protein